MSVHERRVDNRGVQIHVLDSDPEGDAAGTPLVFVPGVLRTAEGFRATMEALAPRRCVALSLRGWGKSDAPPTGYRFEDHVSDLEAVVEALGLRAFCLMGHSMGVPLAVEYAARYPDRLTGLILADYPARLSAFPAEWAGRVLDAMPGQARPHVVEALHNESREVVLWDRLARVECPVLILRGGRSDSLLSPEDSQTYLQRLPSALVVVFDESGHELWEPDAARFVGTLRAFLHQLDGGTQ
jgi:pimeloyl-ACP methyl ester carboxylesterase